MEPLVRVSPQDMRRSQLQYECSASSEGGVDALRDSIQGKTVSEQRAYLEKHHRDALEKFGDLLRPLNFLSSETDEQAVTRLLNDLRAEGQKRCAKIR